MSKRSDQARRFAIEAHGDQTYGDRPYGHHLDAVAERVTPFGEDAMVVGYLHDVVEDTPVSCEDIERRFGPFVARCVALVSDEPGANRKERKTKTYAKLSQVGGEERLALVVKTADRLANVEACIRDDKRKLLKMYRNEHPQFHRAVYREGLCEKLWAELEGLMSLPDEGRD